MSEVTPGCPGCEHAQLRAGAHTKACRKRAIVPVPEERAARERWAKVKRIADSTRRVLSNRARYPSPEDTAQLGLGLAQLGAMLVDVGEGCEPGSRGSKTTKVRKALGYTYP